MDLEIANALYGYFETLYFINQNLIKLCGADVLYYKTIDYEKLTLDIIQDIPRIVPYSYNNKKRELILDNRNGLLEYQNKIQYLQQDYQKILITHKKVLNKVRKIRNKYEHKMHDVKYKSSGSGTLSLFDIEFNVNGEDIEIYVGELIETIKDVNILFSKIAQEVNTYAYENGKQGYAYYERLCRFDFKDFNDIYESNILRKIGKVINKF